MEKTNVGFGRRSFIRAGVAALGASAFPGALAQAQGKAKYTRYNVMSAGGKRALASYAKGVEAMLNLPATDPHNWFRNAFVHLMDCPHGNWWFYVWHRGYLGYFEETIRNLSGDSSFAMPYWDWTTLPQLPDSMFDGALTPTSAAFAKYTSNIEVFTEFIQPTLSNYWKTLNTEQLAQLRIRNYKSFDLMWNDVTGYDPTSKQVIAGNMCYANTCGARYVTKAHPQLDETAKNASSPETVLSGLEPVEFYNANVSQSFTSSKTPSHNSPAGSFAVLEGNPHNKIHNFIGGVGHLGGGPYGNMTNFLSPVDPIFFLHHSNMDRLWDVWTKKQQALGLPILPTGSELEDLKKDPFVFFVDAQGKYVTNGRAGEYLSTDRWRYDYEPGFGMELVGRPHPTYTSKAAGTKGIRTNGMLSLSLSPGAIKSHVENQPGGSLIAEITLPHSTDGREFDVIVGAPSDVTKVDTKSPYYAGTISFFGHMSGMAGMVHDVTFAVPLPRSLGVFRNAGTSNTALSIRVVPSKGSGGTAPAVKGAVIRVL